MQTKLISYVVCALIITTVIIIELPNDVIAQPTIQWDRNFGGTETDFDLGTWVQQTSDKGYILVGVTESYGAGQRDGWLIKNDSSGNEQWNITFGGSEQELLSSVQQTSDKGYILVGMTESYGASQSDVWLIKTDSSGNEQWNKTFGTNKENVGRSVKETSDSGYIICGWTRDYGPGSDDAWLIKTDSSGNEQWNIIFGGSGPDGIHSVQLTADGGYVAVGTTQSYGAGDSDAWLIKTNSSGIEQWNKTFGGGDHESAYSGQETSDNGYIIIGHTKSYGGGEDVWLIKTDSHGDEQWNKTFDSNDYDIAYSVQEASDGGYIFVGSSYDYYYGWDIWLIKTDSHGDEQWNITLDRGGGDDVGRCVQQTSDNGYIVVGATQSSRFGRLDVWLIKLEGTELPNHHPTSDAGPDHAVYEGDAVPLDGSASYDSDGTIISYEWDFDASVDSDGDGDFANDVDAIGPTPTHIYGDDGVFIVTLRVTDNDNLSAIDTCNISVQNVDPTVTIESITMDVEIGLRVAGRKYNDVGMTLYEEGISVGYVSIERMPGSPDEQMAWIPVSINFSKSYTATVTYTPEDPPNIGANPVWIYIKSQNGSIRKIHHTFNVQQSMKRDSEHWNHVEPWEVDLSAHFIGLTFEISSHITDPGSDDETLTYSYGSQVKVVTYLNNPPNSDPYPSPEVNPVDIMDTTTLVYEGPGTLYLDIIDDDGGVGTQTITIS